MSDLHLSPANQFPTAETLLENCFSFLLPSATKKNINTTINFLYQVSRGVALNPQYDYRSTTVFKTRFTEIIPFKSFSPTHRHPK